MVCQEIGTQSKIVSSPHGIHPSFGVLMLVWLIYLHMEATLHKVACSFVEWFSTKVFYVIGKAHGQGFFFLHDSCRVSWIMEYKWEIKAAISKNCNAMSARQLFVSIMVFLKHPHPSHRGNTISLLLQNFRSKL
jgi:hypothetical protein